MLMPCLMQPTILQVCTVADAASSSAAGGGSEDAAARAELGLGDNYYSTSAGQRDRMLAATERMQKTSDRLQVGKQQLAETEVSRAISMMLGFFCVLAAVPGFVLVRLCSSRRVGLCLCSL